jgi:hypothetical protein
VISVRFKLASSFLLSKEGELRGQSLVPDRLHVFPDMKRNPTSGPLRAKQRGICRIIPADREPSRIAPVEPHP